MAKQRMSSKLFLLLLSPSWLKSVSSGAQSRDVASRKPASRVSKTQIPESRRNVAVSRPIRPLPRSKGKASGYRRAPSPMTLPPLPLRPRWPGEDERKQQFIDDPDVERVEPHRLLCKLCNCWIKLHPIIRYSQSVWPRHKASCKDIQLIVCVLASCHTVIVLPEQLAVLVRETPGSERGAKRKMKESNCSMTTHMLRTSVLTV